MINLDINCAINILLKNDIKLDKDEYILCEYRGKHIKNLLALFNLSSHKGAVSYDESYVLEK